MKNKAIRRIMSAALVTVVLSLSFALCTEADDGGYQLWIGGEYITEYNAADPFGNGTASYNAETNTLTLNGFTYEGEGSKYEKDLPFSAAVVYEGKRDLTVELYGENVITLTGAADYGSVLTVSNDEADLTLTGEGSLTLTCGSAQTASYGLFAADGLNINCGSLTAVCEGQSPHSTGITGGDVVISGGNITAKGGAGEKSVGLYGTKSITLNGGSVTAAGKDTSDYSAGTYCRGPVTVTGGVLITSGGAATNYSDGIYSGGDFTVGGGSVTATGGASEWSSGLFLTGNTAQIAGGIVTLEGGEGKMSRGINELFSEKKEIRITDGVRSATITGKELALGGTLYSAVGGVGSGDDGEDKEYIVSDTDLSELQYKTIVFPHAHDMKKIDAKKPSAREMGNIEYYACSGCDSYFEDADGKILIQDKNSVLIPALGEADVPPESSFPWLWVIIPAVLAVAAATVIIIVIIKKKSKKQTDG